MRQSLAAVLLVVAAYTPAAAAPFDELLTFATANGSVRLVVKIYAPSIVPEGTLGRDRTSVVLQRLDIGDLQDAVLATLTGTAHQVLWRYATSPYLALEVTADGLRALAASPLVEDITQDFEMSPQLGTTGAIVQADDARVIGLTGEGQAIVIIDSGVDRTHPFLAGRVVDEWCAVSSAGGCPNGANGAGAAAPVGSHGTHVAGIAAGSGNAFSGVAPGASIVAMKVFPASGGASFIDVKAALDRVIVLKESRTIAAVNMSLGTADYTSSVACDGVDAPYGLKPDIDTLRAAGIPTVVSTGNDGFVLAMSYPACLSSTIKAGASTKTDAIAFYANLAPALEATTLLAPGGDGGGPSGVCSSRPSGFSMSGGDCAGAGTGGAFEYASGTSMAAPHIAGAWAVLKQAKPTAAVDDILSALRGTATSIVDTPTTTTYRRVRARDAVAAVTGLSVMLGASHPSPQAASTSITLTAMATGGVGTLRYKFRIHDGSSWTVVRDWSTSQTVVWTPTTAGSYAISVWARSATIFGDAADGPSATASRAFSITGGGQSQPTPTVAMFAGESPLLIRTQSDLKYALALLAKGVMPTDGGDRRLVEQLINHGYPPGVIASSMSTWRVPLTAPTVPTFASNSPWLIRTQSDLNYALALLAKGVMPTDGGDRRLVEQLINHGYPLGWSAGGSTASGASPGGPTVAMFAGSSPLVIRMQSDLNYALALLAKGVMPTDGGDARMVQELINHGYPLGWN